MTTVYLCVAPDGSLELWTSGAWETNDPNEGTWKRERNGKLRGWPMILMPDRDNPSEDVRNEQLQPPEYWGREVIDSWTE